jgi:hypothetical protein
MTEKEMLNRKEELKNIGIYLTKGNFFNKPCYIEIEYNDHMGKIYKLGADISKQELKEKYNTIRKIISPYAVTVWQNNTHKTNVTLKELHL